MINERRVWKGDVRSNNPIPFTGLLTNKLLSGLCGEDPRRLLPHVERVRLPTGCNLYEFGEEITFVYFPETTVLSDLHLLEDGGATAAAIIGSEGMVGLSAVLDNQPSPCWTKVIIGGSAFQVETEIIKLEFNLSKGLHRVILAHTNARLEQLSQRVVCNSRHRLDERLCTWLLMIHDRAAGELPFTHEMIAEHLGARRAGVTAACNVLRDNGIIEYRRGQMRILNRRMLEGAACECYRALAN